MLPLSLSVPDVRWLSLNPLLEGLIVPSKFYGIAAAGKPTLMIGHPDGEIARLLRQRCGITIAPGGGAALADTLRRWSEAPQAIAEMGARAADARLVFYAQPGARSVEPVTRAARTP